MLAPILLAAALALVVAAAVIWLWSRRAARATGLPKGRVVYSDAADWKAARPLRSERYGLSGKPDYLVERGADLIPVEVKPTRRAPQPYDSDLLQLAAYCLLVEETSGRRPPHGIIVYASQQWEIPYTDDLRDLLLATLDAIRDDRSSADVARSHETPGRCRACSYRAYCDQAL